MSLKNTKPGQPLSARAVRKLAHQSDANRSISTNNRETHLGSGIAKLVADLKANPANTVWIKNETEFIMRFGQYSHVDPFAPLSSQEFTRLHEYYAAGPAIIVSYNESPSVSPRWDARIVVALQDIPPHGTGLGVWRGIAPIENSGVSGGLLHANPSAEYNYALSGGVGSSFTVGSLRPIGSLDGFSIVEIVPTIDGYYNNAGARHLTGDVDSGVQTAAFEYNQRIFHDTAGINPTNGLIHDTVTILPRRGLYDIAWSINLQIPSVLSPRSIEFLVYPHGAPLISNMYIQIGSLRYQVKLVHVNQNANPYVPIAPTGGSAAGCLDISHIGTGRYEFSVYTLESYASYSTTQRLYVPESHGIALQIRAVDGGLLTKVNDSTYVGYDCRGHIIVKPSRRAVRYTAINAPPTLAPPTVPPPPPPPPAAVYAYGLAGPRGGYEYTLGCTLYTPAGDSPSSYAWTVDCPGVPVVTSTNATFVNDYTAQGAGAYSASLVVTFAIAGAVTSNTVNFTLPNADDDPPPPGPPPPPPPPPPPTAPAGSMQVVAWFDANQDSVRDWDEAAVVGRSVMLNGPDVYSGTTDGAGYATFVNITAGTYAVLLTALTGEVVTGNGGNATVSSGALTTVNRPVIPAPPPPPPPPPPPLPSSAIHIAVRDSGTYVVRAVAIDGPDPRSGMSVAYFSQLPAGTYTASVTPDAADTGSWSHIVSGVNGNGTVTDPFELAELTQRNIVFYHEPPSPPPPPPPPPSGYSISGNVTLGGSPYVGRVILLTGGATDSYATDANGDYIFSSLAGGNYTVAPDVIAGEDPAPPSYDYTPLASNQTGQDFVITTSPPPP